MSKQKTLFFSVCSAILILAFCGMFKKSANLPQDFNYNPHTKYGAFLAAQHAIYVNDFESVTEFIKDFPEENYDSIKSSKILAEFLGGKISADAKSLMNDTDVISRLMYDAYLVQNEQWIDLYKRHKANKSSLYAPFHVWGAMGAGQDPTKFIDDLESNPSWKAFMHGQVYAEQGDFKRAADAFANVSPSFMNMNDYFYLMSFYRAHNMEDAAEKLRKDFSSAPGGMFMVNFNKIPDWSMYSGKKNALAFNLVQNVSHTQSILYSDFSILMLCFAKIIGPETPFFDDMINYYTGVFFSNVDGDYAKYFSKIDSSNPFSLFAQIKMDESLESLNNILSNQPLFMPALTKIVALHTGAGDKNAALRAINRAMKTENLTDIGRAYLVKRRALVYLIFGDVNRAQADIHDASGLIDLDGEIMYIQARIWAAQNREIESAYEYAMNMVRNNPTDIMAWDAVAVVVSVREGNDAALDILERVGKSAKTCSALFEHLGDAYVKAGKENLAKIAYSRAIELSGDGFSIAPNIRKKLRKLK